MRKRILCFGDSNTWGYIPRADDEVERYDRNFRWTGVLQSTGKDHFEIIEEGLNGRTTSLDEPGRPGRNGLAYLLPCLESQSPLDAVVLMLGTNDLKKKFTPDPQKIAERMRTLIQTIRATAKREDGGPVQIILAGSFSPIYEYAYDDFKYEAVGTLGSELNLIYEKLAGEEKTAFLSLKNIECSQKDGVHLDPEMHLRVAERVFKKLLEIF